MATVDSVASELALEFGEQFQDIDIADQFRRWVQQTYEEIVQLAPWFFKNDDFSIQLEQGVKEYTLPTTVSAIRDFSIYSATDAPTDVRGKLSYTPVERLTARGENLDAPGFPRAYYITGINQSTTAMQIAVWPVPDREYNARIFAVSRPVVLSSTDTIPLPPEYLAALREGVKAKVRFNDGDLQAMQAAEQKMLGLITGLNSSFVGPKGGPSRLGVKRLRGTHQSPTEADGA
jgi:hypothetical protein